MSDLKEGMGIDTKKIEEHRYHDTDHPQNLPPKKAAGRPPKRKPIPDGKQQPNTPVVGKTKRRPVGLRRTTEQDPVRKGYKRRWVNDYEDRLQVFQDGGYTPVMDENGSPKTRRSGAGKRAVLMEIPEDIYNEDQQTKYRQWNKDNEERLKPRESGYYTPKSKAN